MWRIATLYLDGASACDDVAVLNRPLHYHDSIVQTSLNLLDKLFGTSTENERASFRFRTFGEQVVPLAADLLLLEGAARSQVLALDVGAGGLD